MCLEFSWSAIERNVTGSLFHNVGPCTLNVLAAKVTLLVLGTTRIVPFEDLVLPGQGFMSVCV